MEKEKYAAIIEYSSGATTGAWVVAESEAEAWAKLMAATKYGKNISKISLEMVLTEEMGCL